MSYSKLILKDNPDIVWPLDDINESSSVSYAINFFSQTASQYCAFINASATTVMDLPIVFGGGTALSLTTSATYGLSIPLMYRFSELYNSDTFSIEFWLRMDKVPAIELPIVKKRNNSNIGLFIKENYLIYRYGNGTDKIEAVYGRAELDEPTHIVMNYSPKSVQLIVNGVSVYSENIDSIEMTNADYDFFDFYGNSDFNVIIDSPAIYGYQISENIAKRHYFYGLGKSINESIFFNMGGDYYNFSTKKTRKSYYKYWDFPKEWQLTEYNNVIHKNYGITTNKLFEPILYSSDNNIYKQSNSISFTSSTSVKTSGTYIDLNSLIDNVGDGSSPFLVKVRFDRTPPSQGLKQTIMCLGEDNFNVYLSFELINTSGSYYVKVNNQVDSQSNLFYIPNITASPTAYIGMKYDSQALYYFSLSGSSIQTASNSLYSGSVYYNSQLSYRFPPTSNSMIRIGSNFNYNNLSTVSEVKNINQFYGTFLEFIVLDKTFSGSSYSSINSYASPVYSATYDTSLDRFKIKTFGNANFIIHGSKLAELSSDYQSFIISSNRFEFGYPDVVSGSQVSIYATLYDYGNNIIKGPVLASKINNFEWLNLIDLKNRYLRFDINILSNDTNYYPPIIKYFKGETYPFSGSYVDILDDGGDKIRIRNSASGHSFIPEFYETPTMFITDSSGVKVYRNFMDVEFSPAPKPLQIILMSDLVLWLDSRFPLGFRKQSLSDSSSYYWNDLSNNAYSVNNSSSFYPEYRIQSLNLLSNNIANGAESGSITGLSAINSVISPDVEGAVAGVSSIKIAPDGTSIDSYAQTSASLFLFASQQYTIVGSITLDKVQQHSSLSSSARRICVLTSGSDILFTNQAPNEVGTHTVSATFTTSNTPNRIRLYN